MYPNEFICFRWILNREGIGVSQAHTVQPHLSLFLSCLWVTVDHTAAESHVWFSEFKLFGKHRLLRIFVATFQNAFSCVCVACVGVCVCVWRVCISLHLHSNQTRSVKTVPREGDFHCGSERTALAQMRKDERHKPVEHASPHTCFPFLLHIVVHCTSFTFSVLKHIFLYLVQGCEVLSLVREGLRAVMLIHCTVPCIPAGYRHLSQNTAAFHMHKLHLCMHLL